MNEFSSFLRTKVGIFTMAFCVCLVAFVAYRVSVRRKAAREAREHPAQVAQNQGATSAAPKSQGAGSSAAAPSKESTETRVKDRMSAMSGYQRYAAAEREDTDVSGHKITRRETAARPSGAGTEHVEKVQAGPKMSLRISGNRGSGGMKIVEPGLGAAMPMIPAASALESGKVAATDANAPAQKKVAKPVRFLPYGYPIKCELVMTLDSTNEDTPLVGLVTEPVYNNGQLVIPANTELHGVARPDRLRDRILSGGEWVVVYPREGGKPNGRQLKVKGVALERVQPDGNGMTWGLSDGSFGLQGSVIRTNDMKEIELFASSAVSAAAASLQQRQGNMYGGETVNSTPRNAALAGVSAVMSDLAKQIKDEIDKQGVYIRVPAGHQFYFYPQQIIDSDAADVSSNVAKVD